MNLLIWRNLPQIMAVFIGKKAEACSFIMYSGLTFISPLAKKRDNQFAFGELFFL